MKSNVRGGKKRTYRRKTVKKSGKVGLAVKRYVKKTINGKIENKVYNSFTPNIPVPCTVGGTPIIFALVTRNIAQGVSQSGRLGNMIECVGGTSKFRFNLRDYSTNALFLNPLTRPAIVKLWLVSARQTNDWAVIEAPGFFSAFFQNGSSSTSFGGNVMDTMASVNKDLFTVHKQWLFQLGTQINSSVAAVPNYYSGDKYSKTITIPYKKYLGGKWKYNDSSNTVINKNLYLVMQCVNGDGSTGTANDSQIEYHNYSEIIYQDA